MVCQNCNWEWDIEKGDSHPFLCHKCGYDSKLKNFDMYSLKKWEKEKELLQERGSSHAQVN